MKLNRTGIDTRAVSESIGHISPTVYVYPFHIHVTLLLAVYSTTLQVADVEFLQAFHTFSQSTQRHIPDDWTVEGYTTCFE